MPALAPVRIPASATFRTEYPDLFWRRITRAGRNECDGNVVPCERSRHAIREALHYTALRGCRIIRFAASGSAAVDWSLWRHDETRARYWSAFDTVNHDATSVNISLIPSIFWNWCALPTLLGEPLRAMVVDEGSRSRHLARQYVHELVSRYVGSPAVRQWELGNELNLLADTEQDDSGDAPRHVPSLLLSEACAQASGGVSSAEMVAFQRHLAGWIREVDPTRKIQTGHAVPRPNAEHLRLARSSSEQSRGSGRDTREQFAQNVYSTCAGCDLCSMHIYADGFERRRWAEEVSPEELIRTAHMALRHNGTLPQSARTF